MNLILRYLMNWLILLDQALNTLAANGAVCCAQHSTASTVATATRLSHQQSAMTP